MSIHHINHILIDGAHGLLYLTRKLREYSHQNIIFGSIIRLPFSSEPRNHENDPDLTFLMNIHCVHERCTCNGRVLVPKVNANIRPSITSIVGQPILKDIQRLLMKRTSHIMWRILILVPTKSDGVEETTSGIFLNFHHVHIVH